MKAPSIAEPVTELKRVPIKENGEPLVNYLEFCPKVVMDRPRFNYRRETMLRLSAAECMKRASELLPKEYKLAVVEGWRPPYIQARMYKSSWNRFKEMHPEWSDIQLKRVVNRFTAPLNVKVPPPHTTGGATDVALLTASGEPCEMSAPFPWRDPHSFPTLSKGLDETSRKHRQILYEAMIGGGFTNYPSEYWHYSYGDQGWAYRGGHPFALYAAITPPSWTPEEADAIDDPLVFIES